MKKIGFILSILIILLSKINAEVTKDIMVKYKYEDLTKQYVNEVVNNKVVYEINEDKLRIFINENDENIKVMLFKVSGESLEWLKSKVEISENSNVYYFTILNDSNKSNILSDISIEEYSGENKSIKIYDQEGNLLDKATNNCYIVIETLDESIINNISNVVVYEEVVDKIESKENNLSWIVILIIVVIVIGYVLSTFKNKKGQRK